ncbi:hypothetical protein FRC17_003672 [Serendipita sp. 399]|nr:hypothetical protein FRC17_003672 [Serendipita sp. 399]
MPNLRSLDIQGFRSGDRMESWCSDLSNLSTTRLQRLRLSYDGTLIRAIDVKQILEKPYMQALEALFVPSRSLFPTKRHADDFFSNPDMLPNLTTIHDDGNSTLLDFYLHRSIRRVLLNTEWKAMPFENLRTSKTQLTHLSTEYPREKLLDLVVDNLDLFAKLRHLGILDFEDHSAAEIISDLALLSTLPNICSIQLDTLEDNTSYLLNLRAQLPTVARVFHNKTVWWFYDGQWKEVGGQYTSWEIINMGLDSSLDPL